MPTTETTGKVKELFALAQEVYNDVKNIRRGLHQSPETRWEEVMTLEFIDAQISYIFADMTRDVSFYVDAGHKGGYVVDIKVNAGPYTIFRADIDALPIQEETGLEFASKNPGKMHACGHDCHTAMLLGFIKLVAAGKVTPTRNIRCVFQRAEENPGSEPRKESGGKVLVDEGILEDVCEAYMLHMDPRFPVGTLLSRLGPMLANSDRVKFVVNCSGGHVALPHLGENAIQVAMDILKSIPSFGLRTLGPNEPVSFEPGIFQSGTASNVMPKQAEVWFNARNFLDAEKRRLFHIALKMHIEDVVRCLHPSASVVTEFILGHPTLANSMEPYHFAKRNIESAGLKTGLVEPLLGGEDFAYYTEGQGGVPACAWMVGCAQEGSGMLHQGTFNPDEAALQHGVLFWLLLATS